MTEEELREKFEVFGKITSCSIPFDPHTQESRGFGFITYERVESADRAVDEFKDPAGRIRVSKVGYFVFQCFLPIFPLIVSF
jgi:RNA recognition motif-containing protein